MTTRTVAIRDKWRARWQTPRGGLPRSTSRSSVLVSRRDTRVTRLVYFEGFGDVRDAISREKHIKRWRPEKKLALIRGMNPKFRDLNEDSPH
jgi:hypothetical protein